MYVFDNAEAIETFSRTVLAFAKIGGLLSVNVEANKIRLGVVNSSLTVNAEASFEPPLFKGSTTSQVSRIKARAAESIFSRIEPENVRLMCLSFKLQHIELKFEALKSGVVRAYRLDCLDGSHTGLELPSRQLTNSFRCSLVTIKSVLSHFMVGADEAEIRFDGNGQVEFHAHKLPTPRRKAGASGAIDLTSKLGRDMTSMVGIPISQFEQVLVYAPWSARFRLKELRILVNSYLAKNQSLIAEFSEPSEPIYFTGSSLGHQFCFQFLTISSPVRQVINSNWQKIGVRGPSILPIISEANGANGANSAFSDPSLSMTMRMTPEAPEMPLFVSEMTTNDENDVTEVGMTQDAVPARGIFD